MDSRVLVVEDDDCVKTVMNRLFHQIDSNLVVDWATEAEEALVAIKVHGSVFGNPYHLVVADIGLPGSTSGIDLWKKCQEEYPQTRFLFISGMSIEGFFHEIPKGVRCPPYLHKPFSSEECREVLSDILNERRIAL